MNKKDLLNRLHEANPGWDIWEQLLSLIDSLDFTHIHNEYLGDVLISEDRLCFGKPEHVNWPDWMPNYVKALYRMNADNYEMAGGYAGSFTGLLTEKGQVFCEGPGDELLGFPLFDVPPDVYQFQSNSSGALFHIHQNLNILAPNSEAECLDVVDSLEQFTQKNIQQVLVGQQWFTAYSNLPGTFLD
jgi:hypothetical protein